MKKIFSILILLVAAVAGAEAQVSVDATIDSIEMYIGQQVHVTVKATAPEKATVVFPALKARQYLTPGVEIVDVSKAETTPSDNGKAITTKVYTLTSFDGRLYYLPPFKVKVGGREYASRSLALKVLEVDVDTAHVDKFFGPKDVQDNPFSWDEWSPVFWLSVLMLLITGVMLYLVVMLRTGRTVKMPKLRIVHHLLPHQKAMKEIEHIKAEKMTARDDQKLYYTRLTDTLRKYIQERYGFRAMEMTSSEIIDRLTSEGDAKKLAELTELFRTADLVKFARYSTLINENDMNLVNAIDFINSTKSDVQPVEQVVKPQLSEADEKTVRTHRMLRIAIAATAVAAAALLVYVVYAVWLLME